MIWKRRSSINRGEHTLLLIGLGGLLLVGLLFVAAIALVSRLDPTTGPDPAPTEVIATPTP